MRILNSFVQSGNDCIYLKVIKGAGSAISRGGGQIHNLKLQADECQDSREARGLRGLGKGSVKASCRKWHLTWDLEDELKWNSINKRFQTFMVLWVCLSSSLRLFSQILRAKAPCWLCYLLGPAWRCRGHKLIDLKCVWIRLLLLLISHITVISAFRVPFS